MQKINHSTISCPKCGKDSYRTVWEATYGAKCIHCDSELIQLKKDKN